ncbi:hypothetical protein DPMN_070081 [Dreissena polymorpha]|uniref:G-protein coupled receptors family 1 profile domain-containing protein n=1 Tax=Dreissena polymorpha TaxID=45954 RepID=A0A9D3Z5J0_DREPO|nr:hypothetical protein DPMN_070081 [Dreissena polymorpha]
MADQSLWDLNNEKARLFVPAFTYVGAMMLLGTTGNALVLYFYGKLTKPSPSTSFILALAAFDLLTCLAGMPMEIADLRYYYNFKSVEACKILRFVTHFSSISSGLTLLVIALDRYRRICHPFQTQLSNKHVTRICICVGAGSLALSWPAILFNEVVQIEVDAHDGVLVTGHDCTTITKPSYRPYILAFNIVYLIAFVVMTVMLAVLYTLISRQLFRHKKFRFYVTKKGTNVRHINVRSGDASSDRLVATRRSTKHSLSNNIDERSEVGANNHACFTDDLPEVENDRPTSGYTAVTGTTGVTGLTDITGRSRRTTSMKSVTIDPSQNRVYAIEAREMNPKRRPQHDGGGEHDGNENRPGSASSLATFSSRPSSTTFSTISEGHRHKGNIQINRDDTIDEEESIDVDGDDDASGDDENEEANDELGAFPNSSSRSIGKGLETYFNAREKTQEWVNKTIEYNSPVHVTQEIIELEKENEVPVNGNEPVVLEQTGEHIDPTIVSVSVDGQKGDKLTNTSGINELSNMENQNQHENFPTNTHIIDSAHDISKLTHREHTNRTRISLSSKRSNLVTPVTDVTVVSSVSTRASTVRRLRRMLRQGVFKGGKNNTDADNVKDLRMKMLDINTIKYTLIMLTVTLLFVVSFLPYLALVIWRYFHGDEAKMMTDTELVLFQIGIRSIFLNSSLNPVIYGGFNSQFRAFFYRVFCCCCVKKTKALKRTRDQSDSTSQS